MMKLNKDVIFSYSRNNTPLKKTKLKQVPKHKLSNKIVLCISISNKHVRFYLMKLKKEIMAVRTKGLFIDPDNYSPDNTQYKILNVVIKG